MKNTFNKLMLIVEHCNEVSAIINKDYNNPLEISLEINKGYKFAVIKVNNKSFRRSSDGQYYNLEYDSESLNKTAEKILITTRMSRLIDKHIRAIDKYQKKSFNKELEKHLKFFNGLK